MALRLMLDSMIFDAIVADEETQLAIVATSRRGDLVLHTTHIQEDQLAKIGDPTKFWRVKSVPRSIIPTSDFIGGVSRLGMARVGDGRAYELVRNGQKHIEDAEIAATAEYEQIPLVTDDRRLTRRATVNLRVPVWGFAEFRETVRSLGTVSPSVAA